MPASLEERARPMAAASDDALDSMVASAHARAAALGYVLEEVVVRRAPDSSSTGAQPAASSSSTVNPPSSGTAGPPITSGVRYPTPHAAMPAPEHPLRALLSATASSPAAVAAAAAAVAGDTTQPHHSLDARAQHVPPMHPQQNHHDAAIQHQQHFAHAKQQMVTPSQHDRHEDYAPHQQYAQHTQQAYHQTPHQYPQQSVGHQSHYAAHPTHQNVGHPLSTQDPQSQYHASHGHPAAQPSSHVQSMQYSQATRGHSDFHQTENIGDYSGISPTRGPPSDLNAGSRDSKRARYEVQGEVPGNNILDSSLIARLREFGPPTGHDGYPTAQFSTGPQGNTAADPHALHHRDLSAASWHTDGRMARNAAGLHPLHSGLAPQGGQQHHAQPPYQHHPQASYGQPQGHPHHLQTGHQQDDSIYDPRRIGIGGTTTGPFGDESLVAGSASTSIAHTMQALSPNTGASPRPFQCKYCPATFGRKDNQAKHVRAVHQGERPFQCEICGYKFQKKDHCEKHRRIVHFKERPFACPHEQCSSKFGQKSDLNKHFKTVHQKIKPYGCPECGMTFGHRGNLLRHVQVVHRREKKFTCSVCQSSFGERSNLTKHSRAVHGIEGSFCTTTKLEPNLRQ